jgi:phosphatidylglycerophosphatase A
VRRLLLSFFGAGWTPVLPGTAGSLATAALIHAAEATAGLGAAAAGLGLVYGVAVTLAWGGDVTRPDGRGDPGWVVADEVAGQSIASAGALVAFGWPTHLAAFLLFRVLDMTKPGPIRRLERLPGGVGVLMDDLGAGVVAGAVVGTMGWML